MGLFGKKEEADTASTAPAAAPQSNGGDVKKCAICGEDKQASEGAMMLEGTAFRCNDCAAKDSTEEHGETCEFC